MKLKEIRKQLGLTQPEAASIIGIPLRTYCRYEDEEKMANTFKYEQMVIVLNKHSENLILRIDTIKNVVSKACEHFNVSACYLFGSYAKGKTKSTSDVDLMIVSELEGIEYYQLLNELETNLRKKVDLIRLESAIQNVKLLNEILKEGIKIYG